MHSVYVQGIPTKNMPFICATGFRQSRGSWRRVEAGDPRVGMDGLNNMLGKPPYRKLGNLHKENKPSIPNKPPLFFGTPWLRKPPYRKLGQTMWDISSLRIVFWGLNMGYSPPSYGILRVNIVTCLWNPVDVRHPQFEDTPMSQDLWISFLMWFVHICCNAWGIMKQSTCSH